MHLYKKHVDIVRKAIEKIVKEIIQENPELEEGLFNFIRKIETSDDVKHHLDFLQKLEKADSVSIVTGEYDKPRGTYPKLLTISGKWSENGGPIKRHTARWVIGWTEDDFVHKKLT